MATTIEATRDEELDFVIDIPNLKDGLLPKLDALRAHDPIYWSARNQAWLVTGHQEVVDGYYGKLPLSSVRLPHLAVTHLSDAEKAEIPNVMEAPKAWLLNMDDPEHQRLRRLMVKAFGRQVVESVRPDVQRYIAEALDDIATIDGPFDFVAKVARIIPARMILKLLGLDDTLVAKLHRWSVLMNQTGNLNVPLPTLIEVDEVLVEMRALFEPEWEKRRQAPTEDFLSALVTANEDGDRLSDEEMFGICVITLIAGHDTTANTMALGLSELAGDTKAIADLRAMDKTPLDAIMEIQRVAGMSTVMSRVVAEDFDWNGHALKQGQFVILSQLAANRDPAVYPDPDSVDFARKQMPNMVFAPGVHHCIGHLLAKMVLTEFFPAFVARYDWEILDDQLDFGPPMAFRSLDTLTMKVHDRQAATVA